ncbi:MAG: hypothetical protein HFI71_01625 [Lachnospiraceae bacterium]|nr:hypothetical protein [Lachnospiraceae bacterium]
MFRVDKLKYYDKFHCIMDKCPENCCEMNWNILVDEAAYRKYQACDDEKIRDFISSEMPHKIVKKDGKCPFFQKDGLCMLHKEYGETFLCETCRNYPRFTSLYEDLYIVSLAPSCPAVLDILWETDKSEIQSETFYEAEEELDRKQIELSKSLEKKLKLRERFINILHNREIGLGECVEQIKDEMEITGDYQEVSEQAAWMIAFVKENCLINDKIRGQSLLINGELSENIQEDIEKLTEIYSEFRILFEHILVYSVFEQVLQIEDENEEAKQDWLEKICLRLATIQYWILYLYKAKGDIDREDCNIAVYSIMRVLDHDQKQWKAYDKAWKQTGWGLPKILW